MEQLRAMIKRSEALDALKRDFGPGQANQYYFASDTASLITPFTLDANEEDGWRATMPMTDWALRQVCQRLGVAVWPGGSASLPYDYIARCPPHLRASNLNEWVGVLPDERQWFTRGIYETTLDGEQVLVARAVLTDRYQVIGVTETLRWVEQSLAEDGERNGGQPVQLELFNPYMNADVLHLKILMRGYSTPGGDYGTGVYIYTGEIGNRKIGVAPFVMRNSCTNSIWWKADGAWEHRHTGDSRVLRQIFMVHIADALMASAEVLDSMLKAETQKLPSFTDILDEMTERYGWTQSARDNILIGTEGNETVAGMVNGLTWSAQHLGDREQQTDMESIAGNFLYHMVKRGSLADAIGRRQPVLQRR